MAELRVGAATHTGRLRPENEDNFLVADGVFVVADGMGGHEAGEVASQITVDRIGELLGGPDLPSANDVVEAIGTANSDIFRAAIANPEQRGMGTTATAIAVIADPLAGRGAPNINTNSPFDADTPGATDGEAPGDVTPIRPSEPTEALVLANVGDSRTYLFRHERLRRVTVDHSYVQELVATGHITEEEARTHPRRNIVTRALGIEPDVRVDWWTLPIIRGDRFVLCSDGLVDEVADVDISSTLTLESDPQAAADRLVEKANEAGGHDNITVIVIDVIEGDDPPDPTREIDIIPIWADEGTDPTPAGPLVLDADPAATAATAEAARTSGEGKATAEKSGQRGPIRFAIAFGIAAVLVIIFVLFSVWARNGYYVAFNDDDEAIIYRGRSGGVLWVEPTAENEVGPTRDELTTETAEIIDDEPRFGSFDAAFVFLQDGLKPVPETTTTTTSTTTSPTTTVAAGVTTSSGP